MSKQAKRASISELQRITKVDRATIGKRLKYLDWEEGARGAKTYDTVKAIKLITEAQYGSTGEANDPAKERKMLADAEKAELVVARLRGELVSVDEMKSAAAELIKTLYQQIVRIEPAIIASEVVGIKSASEIEIKIRGRLSKIFEDLRSMPDKFLSVETSVEASEDED